MPEMAQNGDFRPQKALNRPLAASPTDQFSKFMQSEYF
jgi:hypothetical protein